MTVASQLLPVEDFVNLTDQQSQALNNVAETEIAKAVSESPELKKRLTTKLTEAAKHFKK